MTKRAFLFPLASLTAVLPQAAAASPSVASPTAVAEATLVMPLSLFSTKDMVFGFLSATSAGTAVLNPNTGALTTTGGVVSLGGDPHPAQFTGAARSAVVVNIKVPNSPITLTRSGGTQTMLLSAFTLQGQSKRSLARMESFTFNVGGTLNVAANQVEGVYTGTFEVTVQYP